MKKKSEEIRLVFLGGVGEIGMSSLAIETERGIVIVDCGVMFPQGRYFGPELIIPDVSYYRENLDSIVAVVVTHGHEDHIGAIPAIFGGTGIPVYAPGFAAPLIAERAEEPSARGEVDLHTVSGGDCVTLAGLEFRFVQVTHSIPDAMALVIRTPAGLIVHSGDFRIDYEPTMGRPFPKDVFTRLGKEGVLLLLSESTNVERAGRTRNERWVADNVLRLIAGHKGRVVISMFSSNIERVARFADLARKLGRRIALVGRSFHTYTRCAMETGHAPFDPAEVVDPSFADEMPGHKLMLLVAGSQGEPRSSLTRASTGDHPDVTIRADDLVVLSSRVIPGNEREILHVTNDLARRGATVLHEGNADVHTSGHAHREELADLLRMVKPRFFVPIHGEYRFQEVHAALAREVVRTLPIVPDLGDILAITRGNVERSGRLDLEPCYVEGPLVGTGEELKLKERRKLLFNGLALVRLDVARKKKGIDLAPQIELHGIPDPDGRLTETLRHTLVTELSGRSAGLADPALEEEARGLVKKVIRHQQGRRPAIVVWVA